MTTPVAKSQSSIFSQIRDAIFYIGKNNCGERKRYTVTYLLYTTVYKTFTCSMCYKIYEHFRKHLLTQQQSGNSSHIGERRKPGTAEHDGSRLWTELQMVARSLDSALAKHQTSVSRLQYFFS